MDFIDEIYEKAKEITQGIVTITVSRHFDQEGEFRNRYYIHPSMNEVVAGWSVKEVLDELRRGVSENANL